MNRVTDPTFFRLIHDFLTIYLPSQRCSSPHTIRAYRTAINLFLQFVSRKGEISLANVTFEMLNYETVSAFLEELETTRNCGTTTRNQRLACLRSFVNYAAVMVPDTVVFQLELQKVPIKKVSTSLGVDYMSETAVHALLLQPDVTTEKGIRNRFLMVLLYDTGARIQEILDLRVNDIRLGTTPVAVLTGKGAKIRTTPLMQITVDHLRQYIPLFHKTTDSYSEDYLFYTVRCGLKQKLSDDAVRKFMHEYADSARAGCPEVPANVHPHLWRHSRAMHLYQHGMDLTLVAQWLGHANLETTLIYAYADTEQKRRAIERATTQHNPLNAVFESDTFRIDDEDMLKRLYGLK